MNTSGRPAQVHRRRRVRALVGAALVTGLLTIWVPAASAQHPAPPPEPRLLEPIGVINTNSPTYRWEPAGSVANGDRATDYHLWIQTEFDVPGQDRVIADYWISAADAGCGAPTATECSEVGGTGGPGTHTWYVQARNAAGIGFFSAGLGFVVS